MSKKEQPATEPEVIAPQIPTEPVVEQQVAPAAEVVEATPPDPAPEAVVEEPLELLDMSALDEEEEAPVVIPPVVVATPPAPAVEQVIETPDMSVLDDEERILLEFKRKHNIPTLKEAANRYEAITGVRTDVAEDDIAGKKLLLAAHLQIKHKIGEDRALRMAQETFDLAFDSSIKSFQLDQELLEAQAAIKGLQEEVKSYRFNIPTVKTQAGSPQSGLPQAEPEPRYVPDPELILKNLVIPDRMDLDESAIKNFKMTDKAKTAMREAVLLAATNAPELFTPDVIANRERLLEMAAFCYQYTQKEHIFSVRDRLNQAKINAQILKANGGGTQQVVPTGHVVKPREGQTITAAMDEQMARRYKELEEQSRRR